MFSISSATAAPSNSRPLWAEDQAPAFVGSAPGTTWTTVEAGRTRLAVAGSCFAGKEELHHGLAAIRAGRWRELTQWPGSYWAIADDGHSTAVLTDVAGTRPVYLATYKSRTEWSTSATALAQAAHSELDYQTLTARMVCPTVPEVCGDGTAFHGVRRLPAGHALLVDREGRSRTVAYETMPGPVSSFYQAADELRTALTQAVAARARSAGHVTADFSGGLDSTSLALLACAEGIPVHAVTHADPTSSNDDLSYALRAATACPELRHELVEDPDGLFFEDVMAAPHTDQPFPDAARWRMRDAYQSRCVGSDAHLTGSGADTLLSVPPYYLADLARQRRTGELWRHCLARARLRHLPVHAVVAAAVRLSCTGLPDALRQMAAELRRPAPAALSRGARLHWCMPSGLAAWLTPPARLELADRALRAAENCHLSRADTSRWRTWSELGEFGTYEAELRNQAHGLGVAHQAPYLDNAVVRAAMSVPVACRASLHVQKPLLGAALDGLVPSWLLGRRTKGSYDGNAYTGLHRNAEVVRELIQHGRLAQEGWIEPGLALSAFERMAAGVPDRFMALEALVTTELWLHQLHQTQEVACARA
ncbi:albusnodin/ikarugamycin family macrolactam cyclase [Streptomyces sp. CA-250714]|uniref:albusnodin/ikarugamycin family macrolactam cyclase n=1 Tax=Streptomyces sp. CA-250714 TaxID=3240060 RepID=UPI003D9225AD